MKNVSFFVHQNCQGLERGFKGKENNPSGKKYPSPKYIGNVTRNEEYTDPKAKNLKKLRILY